MARRDPERPKARSISALFTTGDTPARTWYGRMPVQFRYTPGAAGLRFFQTLKRKGMLAATRCVECNRTYLPPRVYCEECFAPLDQSWLEVPPRGHVHSFTVLHRDAQGGRLRSPEIVAFVRIDGTDGGLLARLEGISPGDVRIEMPVEAVLPPARRRKETIQDLLRFVPSSPLKQRAPAPAAENAG